MLEKIPASRVLHDWSAIRADLAKAIESDPLRDWMDVLGQAIAGQITFWRAGDKGHLATQITKAGPRRTWWVIYAGGQGGSLSDKRALMDLVEHEARKARCFDLRFEGRDWRKVFPDYSASRDAAGRWHYRKVL